MGPRSENAVLHRSFRGISDLVEVVSEIVEHPRRVESAEKSYGDRVVLHDRRHSVGGQLASEVFARVFQVAAGAAVELREQPA
jgi:hypothetical protein